MIKFRPWIYFAILIGLLSLYVLLYERPTECSEMYQKINDIKNTLGVSGNIDIYNTTGRPRIDINMEKNESALYLSENANKNEKCHQALELLPYAFLRTKERSMQYYIVYDKILSIAEEKAYVHRKV